jgi:hypothetical protein
MKTRKNDTFFVSQKSLISVKILTILVILLTFASIAFADQIYDSDNGKNYLMKGTVYTSHGDNTDYCVDENTLMENWFYTDDANVVHIEAEEYYCENGCTDGACLETPLGDHACEDTDGEETTTYGSITWLDENEWNHFAEDTCLPNNRIAERICTGHQPDVVYLDCPLGTECSEGACKEILEEVCNDPDQETKSEGIYEKTTTKWTTTAGQPSFYTDSCTSETQLVEGTCSLEGTHLKYVTCPSETTCSNGACIKIETFEKSCAIWYGNNVQNIPNQVGNTPWGLVESCTAEEYCSLRSETGSFVTCDDGCTNSACINIPKPMPIAEGTDMLILEDIGPYIYQDFDIDPLNFEGGLAIYMAQYYFNEEEAIVGIYEFTSKGLANKFLVENFGAFEKQSKMGITMLRKIEEKSNFNQYSYAWISDKHAVLIAKDKWDFSNNDELISAYFNKYPGQNIDFPIENDNYNPNPEEYNPNLNKIEEYIDFFKKAIDKAETGYQECKKALGNKEAPEDIKEYYFNLLNEVDEKGESLAKQYENYQTQLNQVNTEQDQENIEYKFRFLGGEAFDLSEWVSSICNNIDMIGAVVESDISAYITHIDSEKGTYAPGETVFVKFSLNQESSVNVELRDPNGDTLPNSISLSNNGNDYIAKFIAPEKKVKFVIIDNSIELYNNYLFSISKYQGEILPIEEEIEYKPYTEKCNGCNVEDQCVGVGLRFIVDNRAAYCDFDYDIKKQKLVEEACQNDYECLSNSCSNGKCVDFEQQLKETTGILEGLVNWLKKFFGFFD